MKKATKKKAKDSTGMNGMKIGRDAYLITSSHHHLPLLPLLRVLRTFVAFFLLFLFFLFYYHNTVIVREIKLHLPDSPNRFT